MIKNRYNSLRTQERKKHICIEEQPLIEKIMRNVQKRMSKKTLKSSAKKKKQENMTNEIIEENECSL